MTSTRVFATVTAFVNCIVVDVGSGLILVMNRLQSSRVEINESRMCWTHFPQSCSRNTKGSTRCYSFEAHQMKSSMYCGRAYPTALPLDWMRIALADSPALLMQLLSGH